MNRGFSSQGVFELTTLKKKGETTGCKKNKKNSKISDSLFWGGGGGGGGYWVNDTTGYTLVKKRHNTVPTYLQRETDTADWSTPTFTLPCPKDGGVHPAMSTFPPNCTSIF